MYAGTSALIDRGTRIARRFGVGTLPGNPALEQLPELAAQVGAHLRPGRIVLITGASGSGKSSLLRHLQRRLDHCGLVVHELPLPEAISRLASHHPLFERAGMQCLGAGGMDEPVYYLFDRLHSGDAVQHPAGIVLTP